MIRKSGMKKLRILIGMVGYIALVFVLEWQLELLRKTSSANFNTQLFLWVRSCVYLLESAGLLTLTWLINKSEKSQLIAWVFTFIGLFLAFYIPVATLLPALPSRFIPLISSSEFVGAYYALLGIYLLMTSRKFKS